MLLGRSTHIFLITNCILSIVRRVKNQNKRKKKYLHGFLSASKHLALNLMNRAFDTNDRRAWLLDYLSNIYRKKIKTCECKKLEGNEQSSKYREKLFDHVKKQHSNILYCDIIIFPLQVYNLFCIRNLKKETIRKCRRES